MQIKKIYFFISLFLLGITINGQSLEKDAISKIALLEKLVKKAKKKNIDVLKEETTIRTAEVFLKFANWDENNIEKNTNAYKLVPSYKKDASKMAKELSNFERKDVNLMLDKAITEIKSLIAKRTFRKESPRVDWTKVTVDNDHLTFNNRPVFLADYTWKPKTKDLTEFHGNQDGFFFDAKLCY